MKVRYHLAGESGTVKEATFRSVFGTGFQIKTDVGNPDGDGYPSLSCVQVSELFGGYASDMATRVVLKIEGALPADPGAFAAFLAWGSRPDQRAFAVFEMKGDECAADVVMGGAAWFYDPATPGARGPGTVFIGSNPARSDKVLTSEQFIGLGWFNTHTHVDRIVFEAFGSDPTAPEPPEPEPPEPEPPDDDEPGDWQAEYKVLAAADLPALEAALNELTAARWFIRSVNAAYVIMARYLDPANA